MSASVRLADFSIGAALLVEKQPEKSIRRKLNRKNRKEIKLFFSFFL